MDGRTRRAEMHRLEKLFHELDENKDGRIDIQELTAGLKRLGYYHITEEQIEASQPFLIIELSMSTFVYPRLSRSL